MAHGYTYSGHPLACGAALASLDVYAEEGIFDRAARMAPIWEEALHCVRSASPHIKDIRNPGMLGAVDVASDADAFGQRARAVAEQCFENDIFVRALGETLILSPPLIINEEQIGQITDTIAKAARGVP